MVNNKNLAIGLFLISLVVILIISVGGFSLVDIGTGDLLGKKQEIECTVEYYGGIFPDDSLYIQEARCVYSGETCRNIFKSLAPLGFFSTSGDLIFQTADGIRKVVPVKVTTFTKEKTTVILCSESTQVTILAKDEDGLQTDSKIVNII